MRESAQFSGKARRSLRRHQGMWFVPECIDVKILLHTMHKNGA